MIWSIIYFFTVENTQNELPLGGSWTNIPMDSRWGGVNTPNGGSSEMHDWGGVHKITGFMDPRRGGVENTVQQNNGTVTPLLQLVW